MWRWGGAWGESGVQVVGPEGVGAMGQAWCMGRSGGHGAECRGGGPLARQGGKEKGFVGGCVSSSR